MKMIAWVTRLTAPHVATTVEEVCFQLYARLVDVRKRSYFVNLFAAEIGRIAEMWIVLG